MRIGSYQVNAVETGEFALDGGAMFGVVPRTLWERKLPPDDRNRVHLAVRALLVREIGEDGTPSGRNLLVDTGVGQKWDARMADIYGVDHSRLRIETSLRELGVGLEDIDHVLLTHLHFDHAGGATCRNEAGQVVPTFSNARYYVQQRNLDWAQNPTHKDRASYLAENFRPLLEAGVLETLDGDGEFWPGILLHLAHGHTPGMQLPRIHDETTSLIYCADMIPTSAHVPLPWVMAYDNEPLVTMAEKELILQQAVAGDWWIFFEHDPEAHMAKVVHGAKGYAAGERSQLVS